jgi:hypothetical protein
MRAAFFGLVIVAGAALIGRVSGVLDAVPFAFFGFWAALVYSIMERVPVDDLDNADDADDANDADPQEPTPMPAPAPESAPEPEAPMRI